MLTSLGEDGSSHCLGIALPQPSEGKIMSLYCQAQLLLCAFLECLLCLNYCQVKALWTKLLWVRGCVHSSVWARGCVHSSVWVKGCVHSPVWARDRVHSSVWARGCVHISVCCWIYLLLLCFLNVAYLLCLMCFENHFYWLCDSSTLPLYMNMLHFLLPVNDLGLSVWGFLSNVAASTCIF